MVHYILYPIIYISFMSGSVLRWIGNLQNEASKEALKSMKKTGNTAVSQIVPSAIQLG